MRLLGTILLATTLVFGCEQRSQQARQVAQVDSGVLLLQVGLVLESPSADSAQMAFSQKRRGGRNTNEVLNVLKIPGLDGTALENKWQVWQRGDSVCAEVHF